ncbi:MAG: hypothetical protein IKJ45_17775, partial [Kiritimatiellae bacterium]|nr:hypothetical protein [Kiritimatiellia bacterium]
GRGAVVDPVGPSKSVAYLSGSYKRVRVVRGGSAYWDSSKNYYYYGSDSSTCRSASRYVGSQNEAIGVYYGSGNSSSTASVRTSGADSYTGFRVVVTPVVE